MRKICIVLWLTLIVFVLPTHAQWYKNAARSARAQVKKIQRQTAQQLRNQTSRLQQRIVRPVGVTQRQVERAVFQAKHREPSEVTLSAAKALIPLRERHRTMRYFKVKGTAFAIEETYQGKKYVWGVTATHYGYRFPAIPKKRFVYESFSFLAQGNEHANDVSVFRIPESLAKTFKPLKLAEHSPKEGERLFSISFFDNHFNIHPGVKCWKPPPCVLQPR